MKPTLGSLFAGIGGIDLGFERAGFETVFQVELDPFCRRVLAKNFPKADRSVTDVKCGNSKSLPRVDVLAGGFPCQDISVAGRGAGITGTRSGLWKEFHRIIGDLRPKYVLVENVPALLGRGLNVVLGDLTEIGYDAEWDCISAEDAGAPQVRQRTWILAYPASERQQKGHQHIRVLSPYPSSNPGTWNGRRVAEPGIQRMVDGVSDQMDRLKSLGNSVVPQIPEYIAGLILEDMKRPENGQKGVDGAD